MGRESMEPGGSREGRNWKESQANCGEQVKGKRLGEEGPVGGAAGQGEQMVSVSSVPSLGRDQWEGCKEEGNPRD